MPTSTDVTNLKINQLTEAQYDTAVQGGVIGANELSILTDAEVGQTIQVDVLPTASVDELGKIYQFVGTTDANYTNGFFYKCVSDGATPAVYSWEAVEVQASSGGLPDQTGHSGEMLTTDGTDASWGTTIKPITITPASLYYTGVVTLKGYNNNNDILYMNMTPSIGQFEIDVRNNTGTRTGFYYFDSAFYPHATMTTSTLGKSTNVWANVFTAKINNGSDITVPAVAGEMAVKQVNTTITLTAAGWSSNTQTVTVNGVTSTSVVLVAPNPSDTTDYVAAGILCTSQATNSLTFTATTTPTNDIDVNIVCL